MSRSPKVPPPVPTEGAMGSARLDRQDWMHDKDALHCSICDRAFGRIKHRRHHCRHCGRLVCGDCSDKKLLLSADDDHARRVCNDCYTALTTKQKVQTAIKFKHDKEVMLTKATSKVSDVLIRIYFLDGSFKTYSYDDNTTVQDIVSKVVCRTNLSIALFEVKEDLQIPEDFCLVVSTESIVNILARWSIQGWSSGKLVVPLYDGASTTLLLQHSNFSIAGHKDGNGRNQRRHSLGGGGGSTKTAEASSSHCTHSVHKRNAFTVTTTSTTNALSALPANAANATGGTSDLVYPLLSSKLQKVLQQYQQMSVNQLSLHSDGCDSSGYMSPPASNANPSTPRSRSSFSFRSKSEKSLVRSSSGGNSNTVPAPTPVVTVVPSRVPIINAGPRNSDSAQDDESDQFDDSIEEGVGGVPSTPAQSSGDVHTTQLVLQLDRLLQQQISENKKVKTQVVDLHKKYTILKDIQSKRSNGRTAGSGRQSISMSNSANQFPLSHVPTLSWQHDDQPGQQEESLSDRESMAPRAGGDRSSGFEAFRESMVKYPLRSSFSVPMGESSSNTTAPISHPNTPAHTPAHSYSPDGAVMPASSQRPFTLTVNQLVVMTPGQQTKLFYDLLCEIETYIHSYDGLLNCGIEENFNASNGNTHIKLLAIYEIMAGMEGLYTFLLSTTEEWSCRTKQWLQSMLRQHLALPVEDPATLKAILHCLMRENMLFSSDTMQTVDRAIDDAFRGNQDEDHNSSSYKGRSTAVAAGGPGVGMRTLESVLESVNRMVQTLHLVVGDLVPLLPQEFNVISMFQDKANVLIREDITKYYDANKNTMESKDILTLLSFADTHVHLLRKFGIDTSSVLELSKDLITQYCSTVTDMLRKIMKAIQIADVATNVEVMILPNQGCLTSWPEDFGSFLTEQLSVLVKGLGGATRDRCVFVVLRLLPEIAQQQRAWLDKCIQPPASNATNARAQPMPCALSPERLCAYINNHRRFVSLLEQLEKSICVGVDGETASSIHDVLQPVFNVFLQEAIHGIEVCVLCISFDFKMGLSEGLFRQGWDEEATVIRTLKSTLKSYSSDLHARWCGDEKDASRIVSGVVDSTLVCYIDVLVTSNILTMGPSVAKRLTEDLQLLKDLIADYAPMSPPAATSTDDYITVIDSVVKGLLMDLRDMAPYVRHSLYSCFGGQTLKVWQQIMTMRAEPKQVQEAVYEAICRDSWTPQVNSQKPPIITLAGLEKVRLLHKRKG